MTIWFYINGVANTTPATELTSSLSSGRPNTEYSVDLVKFINDWLPRQPRC